MTFEEAAAIKILFASDEAQVVTEVEPILGELPGDEPLGGTVKQYGVAITDNATYWELEDAVDGLYWAYQ